MFQKKLSLRTIVMLIGASTVVCTGINLSGVYRRHPAPDTPPADANLPTLEVELLSPGTNPNEEVECPAYTAVEFIYRIHNTGAYAISGLKLAHTCSCQSNGELPDLIAPGGSALVAFKITSPPAGRIQRRIPLLCDQQTTPLLVLNASLRVRFDPPALLPRSGNLHLTFVNGDATKREIVLETIEAKKDQPWICGLEIYPQDVIEVQPLHVEELPEADPSLTHRRYHFPVINHTIGCGGHTATVRVLTGEGLPTVAASMKLFVEVIDSVTIVPNPLVIRFPVVDPTFSYKFTVIRRAGGDLSVKLAYDHDLLDVKEAEPTTKSIATFKILPNTKSSTPAETEVVFNFGEDGTRAVKVKFESLRSP